MNSTRPASPAGASLAAFQDSFVRALLAPTAPADDALAMQPAFAVYRNTVLKGCIDALQANYPAVTRLVGTEWMRAAAAIYTRAAPPAVPMLLDYGDGFAAFLARFEPAAELPYLPQVACLDRFWTESHGAANETTADAARLAGLAPEVLAESVLRPHVAARWAWFPEAPVYTIWSRNRTDAATGHDLHWQAEGALLTRPGGHVQWRGIDAAACAFLDACAAGRPLGAAAAAALALQGTTDLTRLIADLISAGAFAGPVEQA